MTEGFVNQSAWCAPQPPAFPLLSWIHVIYEPGRDPQDVDSDYVTRAVTLPGETLLHAEYTL